MAISSYGKALASMAKESVMGSVKGFGSSIKSAAMSEMPALTGAIAFARSLRKEAEKYQKETEKSNDEIKDEVKKQVREQKVTNTLTSQMTGLLKSISENTLIQTRFMSQQARLDRQTRMFAEENEREKKLQDKKLLDAIKKAGGVGSGKKDRDEKSLLDNILDPIKTLGGLAALTKIAQFLAPAGLAAGAAALGKKLGGILFPKTTPSSTTKPPVPSKPQRGPRGSQPRIPKGQPGAGSLPAPLAKRIAARLAGAGASAFVPGVGWAFAAWTVYDILDTIFNYDYSIPGSTGPTGPSPSPVRTTGGTQSIPKRPGAEDVGPNMSLQAVNEARRKWDRTYGRTHNPDGTPKPVTKGSFIRAKEGVRLNAYADTSRGYSVGYGHFITSDEIKQGFIDLGDGEKVNVFGEKGKNTKLTAEQAEKLFQKDLQIREKDIVRMLGNENYNKLNEHQKEALRSYYYNVGRLPPGFVQAIATNDFINAQESFRKGVVTAEGVRNQGLVDRRNAEALLFSIGGTPGSSRRPNFGRRSNSNFIVPSSVPSSDVSGGGSIVPTKLVVPVEDEIVAEKIDIQTKAIKNIESSSSKNLVETRTLNENLIPTKRQETRNQRLAREANERFLAGFQALTTTKITNALEKALFPKGYGVTAEQTRADELYRGNALGDLFKTQRFFNRTFGAEYGPLFDQLSRSYLEIGASNVGNMLFGGTAGVDAQALTGQILGNIRQGRKDVALEQLMYGMTGTATGYETLFAKYGFGSAQQGVGAMGNIFGAGATDIVRRNFPFMGEVPGQTTYYDPITKQQVPYGGLMQSPFGTVKVGGLNAQAVFVTNDKQAGVSATASASGAGRSVTIGDPSQIYGYGYGEDLVQATVETNTTLNNQHNEQLSYLEKIHDDDKAWTENSDKIRKEGAAAGVGATMLAAESTGNILKHGFNWLGNMFKGGGGGGGTNLNFGFGGGGTFGDFLIDFGRVTAVNALTKNIKNPTAKFIANQALNRTADVGIQTLMSGGNLATFGSNLSTAFNIPQIASFLGFGTSAAAASYASATAATAAAAKGVTGLTVGAGGTTGLTIGAGGATGITGAGVGGGVGAGIGAGTTTTTAAASSTLGSTLSALATNPATWIVLGALLLFGSKKKAPTAVHKVIVIAGNSNIDAKSTVFTRHDPPKAYYDAADQFLNVAFNTTKMLEIRTGKRAPFDYIYMRVESDRVEIDYGTGALKEHLKSTGPLEGKRLGGGIHTVQIPLVAKQIADHIAEKFKTASSEDTEKIEKGIDDLMKKSFKSLTSGIEATVARDIDLAPSSTESSDLARSVQAASMAQQFQAPVMQTISSGDSEESTGERLIYDFRTGKMVRQSDTGFGVTKGKQQISDGEGGTYEVDTTTYDETIIGIDKAGNPIYGISGGLFKGYAPSFREHLEKNPDLLTSTTLSAGTVIAPAEVERAPINYTEQLVKNTQKTTDALTDQNKEVKKQTNVLEDSITVSADTKDSIVSSVEFLGISLRDSIGSVARGVTGNTDFVGPPLPDDFKYRSPDGVNATAAEFQQMGYVWSNKLQTYVDRHDLDDIESRYEIDPDRAGYGYIVTPQRDTSDRLYFTSSNVPGAVAQEVTDPGKIVSLLNQNNSQTSNITNINATTASDGDFLRIGGPQMAITSV